MCPYCKEEQKVLYLVDIINSLQDALSVVNGLVLVTELKSLVDSWSSWNTQLWSRLHEELLKCIAHTKLVLPQAMKLSNYF